MNWAATRQGETILVYVPSYMALTRGLYSMTPSFEKCVIIIFLQSDMHRKIISGPCRIPVMTRWKTTAPSQIAMMRSWSYQAKPLRCIDAAATCEGFTFQKSTITYDSYSRSTYDGTFTCSSSGVHNLHLFWCGVSEHLASHGSLPSGEFLNTASHTRST